MICSFFGRRWCGFVAAAIFLAGSLPSWAQFEARSTLALPGEPLAMATGDFNNDGKLDLAFENDGFLEISLGNGDGTFQATTKYAYLIGESVAVGDFNGDGRLDIVAPYGDGVGVFLGNGDGSFQAPISSPTNDLPYTVSVGDFNGDHKLDLVIIDPPYISVLLGNGDGIFQAPYDNDSFLGPQNLAVGDFNNSGNVGVAVVSDSGGGQDVGVLLGNGDGTLQPPITYPLPVTPNSVAVGDFNHDGNLDVAVGGLVGVLLGNGDGTLRPPLQQFYGGDVFVGDFNGDGNLDMGTQGYPLGVVMYYGRGNGTFNPEQLYSTGPNGLYTVVGDFNNDQRPDLAFLSLTSDANIVLNTGVASFSPASPLVFPNQLVGTVSPAQAVTFTNVGKKSMSITSIKGSGQFKVSSTCGKSLAPGAKCKINAAFAPTKQGNQTGLITIIDSASSKPEVIELSGAATVITLEPSSLTFAAQKVGTASPPQQVELTNTGKIPLNISKWTLHGLDPGDFSESNNCPASLETGGSCTITVTFKPARTGARSAILYITDTGGGSPQTVSLSGTGS